MYLIDLEKNSCSNVTITASLAMLINTKSPPLWFAASNCVSWKTSVAFHPTSWLLVKTQSSKPYLLKILLLMKLFQLQTAQQAFMQAENSERLQDALCHKVHTRNDAVFVSTDPIDSPPHVFEICLSSCSEKTTGRYAQSSLECEKSKWQHFFC